MLAAELRGLAGVGEVEPGRGLVAFRGDLVTVYRANLGLRTAMRVLLHIAAGECGSRAALYELASAVAWEEFLAPGQTLVVDVAGQGEGFESTAFAALVVKDAVVDRLRTRRGQRPDVSRTDADVRIHVHLHGRRADLALDSSGEPLSHRGYRPRGGPAPLSETLAAGCLLLAGYDGSQPFVDPMAGTGTLAIEAALIATGTAPGGQRTFACERWHFHRPERLAAERLAARSARRPAAASILARDLDPQAVAAIRHNAMAAGVWGSLHAGQGDLRDLPPQPGGSLLLANPPYGERLGTVEELSELYHALGDTFKQRLAGSTAWVLTGSPELAKHIGLRASRRLVLFNGPIECRLLRFDIVEGPLKQANRECKLCGP